MKQNIPVNYISSALQNYAVFFSISSQHPYHK